MYFKNGETQMNKDFTPDIKSAMINIVSYNNYYYYKGGDNMEVLLDMNNGEIIQRGIEDFKNIQRHMLIAKEENATKTYESLKDDYLSLKALLNSLGVNMAEIDKIKE